MSSGDWALLIAGVSLAAAFGSLGWNILGKFIFVKPTVQVTFGLNLIIRPGDDPVGRKQILTLSATNMGPGSIILNGCICKLRPPGNFQKDKYGNMNPIEGDVEADEPVGIGPFGGGLPAKLEAGEAKSFYFPFTEGTLITNQTTRFGIIDSYGRYSWCKKAAVKRVKEQYVEAFGELPEPPA